MWDGFQRRDRAFTFTMSMGLLGQVLGYAARLWSATDQLRTASFYMQLSCLAVGPTFVAAGLYLCLARLMVTHPHVANQSRINWEVLVLIFVLFDIASLMMQAVGGGAAAASYTRSRTMAQGNRCLLTGLSLQAFSMCVFTFCLFRFDWRLYKLYRMEVLLEERNQWHDMTELHSSLAQKLFHGALAFSTLCLVARCAYRVAELSHGWLGPLAHNGPLYIVFEGAMVLLATITMLVFHPVWIYPHPTRQGLPEPPLERPWVPRCLRAWARRRGIASAERIVVPAGINIDLSGPVASHAAEAQNRNQLSMFGAIPAGNQPSRYVKQPTLSGQPSLTVDDMFFLTSPLGNSGAAGSSRRR